MDSSSFGRISGVLSVLDCTVNHLLTFQTLVSTVALYCLTNLKSQSTRGNKSFGLRIQPGWASRKRATLNE